MKKNEKIIILLSILVGIACLIGIGMGLYYEDKELGIVFDALRGPATKLWSDFGILIMPHSRLTTQDVSGIKDFIKSCYDNESEAIMVGNILKKHKCSIIFDSELKETGISYKRGMYLFAPSIGVDIKKVLEFLRSNGIK